MSQSEIEHFIADLKSDEAPRTELSEKATSIAAVVEFANHNGYDITADEARAYMKEQIGQDLSDDGLEALAGGTGTEAVLGAAVIATTNIGGGGAMAVISNNSNISSQAVEVADVQAVVGTAAVTVVAGV